MRKLLTWALSLTLSLPLMLSLGCNHDDEDNDSPTSSSSSSTQPSSPSPSYTKPQPALTITVKHADLLRPIDGATVYFWRTDDTDDGKRKYMCTEETGYDGKATASTYCHGCWYGGFIRLKAFVSANGFQSGESRSFFYDANSRMNASDVVYLSPQ